MGRINCLVMSGCLPFKQVEQSLWVKMPSAAGAAVCFICMNKTAMNLGEDLKAQVLTGFEDIFSFIFTRIGHHEK